MGVLSDTAIPQSFEVQCLGESGERLSSEGKREGFMLASKRPLWPLHKDHRKATDHQQFPFDPLTARLRLAMGRDLMILQRDHQECGRGFRAADLTAPLNPTCRGGTGCLTLAQISLPAFVFQYDLCDLNTAAEDRDIIPGSSNQLFVTCLLALQVYSDVVLFRSSDTYGIRPRRVRQLQTVLLSYSPTRDTDTV